MKYKLKRALPWAEVGQLVSVDDTPLGRFHAFTIYNEDNEKLGAITMTDNQFYEWLERVDERWRPKHGDTYWLMDTLNGGISSWTWREGEQYPESMRGEGCVFRTRELAERAAEQIKALLKEFHKNNP